MNTTPHSFWSVGLSTGCFYQRSIFDILEAVRNRGFTQIEICSYPAHLDYHHFDKVKRAGDLMRDLGLHPFSFHAPFADHIDITSLDPVKRENSCQELLTACKAASRMNVEHMVLHPGPERAGRPADSEFIQHLNYAVESLNRVARVCCELRVNLLLENMLPHLLFGHIGDMLHLVGSIHDCAVGICLDTGHANLAGEINNVVQKFSGHLKMLHANDNLRNFDAHLSPGKGSIDWDKLISQLYEHHFQGAFILELAGYDEPIEATLDRAEEARDYLLQRMPIAPQASWP